MDTLTMLHSFERKIQMQPTNPLHYEDAFETIRLLEKDSPLSAQQKCKELRNWIKQTVASGELKTDGIIKMADIHKKTLLFNAPQDFDCYMQYLEINRAPEDRFYLPRRRILKRAVDAMQRLVNDELDELFLSMPPRVGKTTMLMFFVTWLVGRNSEKSNLYSAYSDVITNSFYSGCLEVINDPYTYLWHDVFPAAKIVSTNSKDETFNVDRKKRYPSLTCRSLYGTLNGACDCNGLLVADDLIGGIEEALNKDRLVAAWSKVDNNLIPRAKEKAKLLWNGTRWSQIDPAGLRMELLLNDAEFRNRRFEIINLPALDANDESNFNYDYGVGYSTTYYYQRRASFERNNDMPSWFAQYMGEPIERAGALFEPQDMKYYNGLLPETGLVRIFMAVDPAYGGGDFVSSPVCYQYEDGRVFVHDVVYDNGDKKITQPLLVNKAIKHNVQAMQFEVSKSTAAYKEKVDEMLREKGYKLNITSKMAPNDKAKEIRIRDKAPEIREFYYIEDGKRTKEYSLFMQNLFSFKLVGRNKNDDAPDSLSMAADMLISTRNTVEVFRRPF